MSRLNIPVVPCRPNLIRLAVISWIQFLNYSILHPLVICDKGGLRQASVVVRMLSVWPPLALDAEDRESGARG